LRAADMNAVGLWLVKTQTIGSTVSSVTVTNVFSADYENYRIVITGGVASTTSNLSLQIGAATTGYYAALTGLTYAGGANSSALSNGGSFTLAGNASTNSISLQVDVFAPQLAKQTWIVGNYIGLGTGQSANFYAGMLNNSTQYTEFTITPSTGTLTGGTIRVYGFRN